MFKKMFVISLLLFTFFGCKPDKLLFEIYTSDLKRAFNGEIVEVPSTAVFSILGNDDKGLLPKAQKIAKKYLNKDAEFKFSKSTMGDILTVKFLAPMGKEKALSEYYKKENCPIILAIGEDNSGMGLYTSGSFKYLKNELKNIDSMLGLSMPSTITIFRVIGDDKEGQEVRAIAVFVDKKPELYFQKKIEHRKSAEILYSGKEGSVYSDPEVLIQLDFIK